MPSFPSRSAVTAHRDLHRQVRVALAPGEVTIGGNPYEASVHIGPVELKPKADGGGFVSTQILTAAVAKALLAVPPKSRSMIHCQNEQWRIDDIGGHAVTETTWIIRAIRFPSSAS